MNFMDTIAEKWHALHQKCAPVFEKVGRFFRKAADITVLVWGYILRFKRIILAIPVAVGAVYLALWSMDVLPAKVGFGIQLDGTYDYVIAREIAILGPIAVTALCLLLMFCSKRTLTPWLVSVFSLALPVLIWVINVFPS
jgi:hypothetical protein